VSPTTVVPTPGAPRPYQFPRFVQRELRDGGRVLVVSLPGRALVTVTALFTNAGAAADADGSDGIAHFAASMLLEGTAALNGALLAERFEALGTSLGAAADWDTTTIGFSVRPEHLAAAAQLAADVLGAPAFPDLDLARLQGEHRAARMHLLADPRGLADSAFVWACYGDGARFRRPVDGTSATVSALTREHLVRYRNERHTRDALTVVVVGDVALDTAVAVAEKIAGAVPRSDCAVPVPLVVPRTKRASVTLVEKPGAAQAELRVGHVGVPRSHPAYFPLTVMNAILGGLFSSRLNLNLREQHGYTYGAFSGFDWRRLAGPWTASCAVQTEVCEAALHETFAEIRRMRESPVSDEELSLAVSYLAGVFPLRFETTASIAGALGSQVIFELGDDYFDTYRARIAAVTTDEVLAVARDHLNPDALQIVVVGDPAILAAPLGALGYGAPTLRSPVDVELAP
jgi:zinc protease